MKSSTFSSKLKKPTVLNSTKASNGNASNNITTNYSMAEQSTLISNVGKQGMSYHEMSRM